MVGKQYTMENVTVLSSDYSAIFDQIKV
jgi:hypothetical protein